MIVDMIFVIEVNQLFILDNLLINDSVEDVYIVR